MDAPCLQQLGFGIFSLYTWSELVDSGELARTLTRCCWLVKPRCTLAYRLTAGAALELEFSIDDEAPQTTSIAAADDGRGLDSVAAMLRALNAALVATQRVPEQLAIIQVPAADVRSRYRVVFAEPGWFAHKKLGDHVGACLCVPPDTRASLVTTDEPATLPTLESFGVRAFDADGSLLGLVSAYAERLAAFAGLDGARCEPRWAQEPDLLVFQFKATDSWESTLRVPCSPQLQVQPILDEINRRLGDQRLYRIAGDPRRVDVALLDKARAAALRQRGELIEHRAHAALQVLADAGFELPALYGEWEYATGTLRTCLQKLCMLATGVAEITAEVDPDGDAGKSVSWRINGETTTTRYPATLARRPVSEVLPIVLGDLNRLLADAGCRHRCLIMSGEPYFYNHRLLLLDAPWLNLVARCREVLPGSLTEATLTGLAEVLGAYPPCEPSTAPPRLPRIDEIVTREDVLEEDFKCSARPSDLPDLVQSLARFARIAVDVDPAIARDGDEFVLAVSHRGTVTTLRLEDRKYVDATPVLDYLNALLEARRPQRQLYYFRGGGWSGGVVRATLDQAARLRAAGYI